MKAIFLALAFSASLVGCDQTPPSRPQRVTLNPKDATSFELTPAEGLPPYCHVFSVGARGTIVQHTSSEDGLSPECPAGKTIGAAALRVGASSQKTKIYAIFSDRQLESAPLLTQIQEFVADKKPVTAVDLRAPGRVVVETLEFPAGG